MSEWIDAQETPPEIWEHVVVRFGDGEVTAGYRRYGDMHKEHGELWPVYNTLSEGNVFGVVAWKPLD